MSLTVGGVISPVSIIYDNLGEPTPFSLDAFQRLRVSSPSTIFDFKQVYGDPVLYFTGTTANGGSVAYQSQRSSTLLSCTSTAGSRAVRQTKRYFNYQAGKSFQVLMTFVATGGAEASIQKSIGYYDDDNGIFFRMNGTDLEVVQRSDVSGSPVDTVVPRSSWNKDKLDGTGPSGITLNTNTAQILFLDFEWLGVGSVRVGFVINGQIIICHQFQNANDAFSVYMRTPNLPVRWEILGGGAAGSLEAICCSVASEGGDQLLGITRSVDRGIVGKSINTANPEQIIAIRKKSTNIRGTVLPRAISIISPTNQDTYWFLCLNPTVGGSPSWTSVTNSHVEYDVAGPATSARIVSNFGTILDSGYFNNSDSRVDVHLGEVLTVASDYVGTSDVLVLGAQPVSSTETYLGSIRWTEPT